MSNTTLHKLHRASSLDRVIEVGFLALWVAIPLAWGSVHAAEFTLISLAVWLLTGLMAIKARQRAARRRRWHGGTGRPKLPWFSYLVHLVIALFILLGLAQLLPLPLEQVERISPKAAEFYSLALSVSGMGGSLAFPLSIYPFATLITLYKTFIYGLFFLLSLHYYLGKEKEYFERLLIVWAGVGTFEAALGIAQTLGGLNNFLWWKAPISVGRARGTFIYVNHYGAYMQLIMMVMLGWLLARASQLHHRHRQHKDWKARLINLADDDNRMKNLILGLACMLMGTALLISGSRGSIISFALVTAIFLAGWLPGKVSKAQGLAVLGVIAAILVTSLYLGMGATTKRFMQLDQGIHMRWELTKAAWSVARDFPSTGAGLGTFEEAFRPYTPEYRDSGVVLAGKVVDHAHNDWVELAGIAGMPVAGVTAVSALVFFMALGWKVSRCRETFSKMLAAGMVAGTFSVVVHSAGDFLFMCPAVSMPWLACLAWACTLSVGHRQGERTGQPLHTTHPKSGFLAWAWKAPLLTAALAIYLLAGWLVARHGLAEVIAPTEIDSTAHRLQPPTQDDVLGALSLEQRNAALWSMLAQKHLRSLQGADLQVLARRSPQATVTSTLSSQDQAALARDIGRENILRNPSNPLRYVEYAFVMLGQERQSPLVNQAMEAAVSLEPTNPEWYYRWGTASLWQGQRPKANELFTRAMVMDPGKYWGAVDRLVPELLAKGQWGNVDPGHASNWLSVSYLENYDYGQAKPK